MTDFLEEAHNDNWKIELRNDIITVLKGDTKEKENAYSRIGYHYKCSAPASLHKYYRGTMRDFENIKANKMWYSAPCNYNDVFDCEITIDEAAIINCVLQMAPENMKIRIGSNAWKKVKREMNQELKSFRSLFNTMRSTMGIACMSESDESILMWSHYANNHRGLCVEYDLMEINHQLEFTPVPIIYTKERVCFNSLNSNTAGNDSSALFIESITSKSEEWSYEQEWRIIRDEAACGDEWDAKKKGALLDMISPISITLGCAVEDEFEKLVRAHCEDNCISLYKMKKDEYQYKLNKVPVIEFNK